jgi:hypothetical protein
MKNLIINKIRNNNNLLIFVVLIILQIAFIMDYNFNSVRFSTRFFSLVFVILIVNGLCFSLTFFLIRKKQFYISAISGMALSNSILFLILYKFKLMVLINKFLDDTLINSYIHIRFINVSAKGNFAWVPLLAAYLGIALLIYGRWFIKSKTDFDNKAQKRLIFMGLGLYLFLFPFVFIFTHFSFVGSNFQYIQDQLKYLDKNVTIYQQNNQHDFFNNQELKWFPNIDNAITYYKDPRFVTKNQIYDDNKIDQQEYYESALTHLNETKHYINGTWKDKNTLSYSNMKNFSQWIQVAYNINFDGANAKNKTLWYSDLVGPEAFSTKNIREDLVRHCILYVRENNDKSVYVMLDFNRTFKDHRINYIFNTFFIVFHLFYLSLFVYLIYLHNSFNIRKKNQ